MPASSNRAGGRIVLQWFQVAVSISLRACLKSLWQADCLGARVESALSHLGSETPELHWWSRRFRLRSSSGSGLFRHAPGFFPVLVCLAALAWTAHAAPKVDFNKDVRSILSDRCFSCHGPDEANRKAGLRLDIEDGAKKPRGKRTPVIPGDPVNSEIVKRISAEKPGMRMPPVASGRKALTEKEIETVKDWIAQGAEWHSHWAFVPPKQQEIPHPRNQAWVKNPIDAFILTRLEHEGLAPSTETDRARLLRRVTLDLTGLPPTPLEVKAFQLDPTPDAYEKVVDHLLASPRYGEQMATAWLDASRYADTHGYQVDPEKQMWAWRDWVIGAFNRNMPFDRFTIEQLAGDLLPNATLQQRIATGFHRNHRINTEAGSIAEEFHAENLVDRVSTTGSVWLGLTVGCARCHDHKYDPITARDFYGLSAFFNNVNEVGTGGVRNAQGNAPPILRLPAPEIEAQLAAADAKLKAAQSELKDVEAKVAAGQEAWERAALSYRPDWRTLTLTDLSSTGAEVVLTSQSDGSVLVSGANPAKTFYNVSALSTLRNITAFRIEMIPDASLPAGGSGRGPNGKGVLTQFDVDESGKKIDMARISADFSSAETLLNVVLRPMLQLKRGWDVNPEFNKPHYAVIEPSKILSPGTDSKFSFHIGNEYGGGAAIGRFRISVTDSEFPEPLPDAVVKALSGGDRAVLRRFYITHPAERRRVAEKVAKLDAARRAIDAKIPTTMVMNEMDSPRDTFVLLRGAYDKPGDKVTPAVPAFLGALPEGAPKNRLALAQWLVSPSNPLTARVAVNRYWQAYFGMGLVKTSEDFGSQGDAPSHPELLDWLATEFVKTGWDVKAMQKLIVMSATYRQSSKATPLLLKKDPENRWLARGPRFRLAAEEIRDQALAVSGLLTEKIGGPSVKPYQPAGLWEQLSVVDDKVLYVQSKGADLYRRSLYTFWKRTVPPPALTTFDAPTREFCVVSRTRSMTPLQALALLNDETYTEASRKLAERMMKEGGVLPSQRLGYGFKLAAARAPGASELLVLQAGWERRLSQYRSNRKAAEELLSAGESARDTKLDAAELAAYTTAASVILNLDEVITKQ